MHAHSGISLRVAAAPAWRHSRTGAEYEPPCALLRRPAPRPDPRFVRDADGALQEWPHRKWSRNVSVDSNSSSPLACPIATRSCAGEKATLVASISQHEFGPARQPDAASRTVRPRESPSRRLTRKRPSRDTHIGPPKPLEAHQRCSPVAMFQAATCAYAPTKMVRPSGAKAK